jgi:tetratricopeptide (TPR) repeat protein
MLNQAIREDPQSADALTNFGQVHKWRGDLDRAESYCSRALAINPWHSEAQFLQALNALDRGDYGRGFPLYECRWRSRTNGYRKLECFFPEWSGPGATFQGEPLKRLFVYCEQGAGDIFLMLRYAPLIRAAGMWQSWAVKRGMAGLAGELVDHVTENAEPPVEFDCHVASASLPAIFGTTLQTVPRDPYLKAPAAVDYGPGFHVGIAWRGNKGQYNDAIRSTALSDWRPVMELAGDHPSPWPSPLGGEREHGSHRVTFHALQVDGAEEALLYPEIEMHEPPKDWSETAARLAGLDLLITVDTGIAHLAGAMGLPVWCALHCRPYFVFPLACEGSPWYPTMRLFKQQRAFEWQPVFSRIADELRKTLSQIHRPVAKPMGLVSGSQV